MGIADVADYKMRRVGGPAEADRQIIEDHHVLTYVEEAEDHVAADVAGTSRY